MQMEKHRSRRLLQNESGRHRPSSGGSPRRSGYCRL